MMTDDDDVYYGYYRTDGAAEVSPGLSPAAHCVWILA